MSGLRINGSLIVPDAELRERFSRSSGPGGQGVNTTDSRVELLYDIGASAVLSESQRHRLLARLGDRLTDGVLTVAASDQRAQLQNRRSARERMAALLRDALAPPPPKRRPTRRTRGSNERRLQGKKERGQIKAARKRPDW